MIWSIALTILGGAKRFFGWIFEAFRQHPWQFALAIVAVFAWWQWSGKREAIEERDTARAALSKCKNDRSADRKEWNRKVEAAKAATAKAQREAEETADDAEEAYRKMRAANDGLRAHIARNRLRGQTGSPANPAGTGGDNGPEVPPDSASETLVATRESDLVICDDLYSYSAGAYALMLDLRAKGLALPKPEFGN